MNKLDILEAIEIALGNTIGYEMAYSKTVDDNKIKRTYSTFKRICAELDPGMSVQELLEAMDE